MTYTIDIDFTVICRDWPDMELPIEAAVTKALSRLDMQGTFDVSIVLTDDEHMRSLNNQYRAKNKPTNVLSFPQDDESEAEDQKSLGDILLGFQTVQKEAENQTKQFQDHVVHLVVHGLLHLLGYDHEEETEARIMETLEIDILETLGIKNPYEDDYIVS